MYPELLGVIKSYGLLLALSFALGMWLSTRRGRRHGLPPEVVLDLVFAVLISSVIGVRLAYVLTHLGQFHPWYRALFLWDGGLTLYGGILASILTVWILTRRRGIPFLVIADIFSPGVVLGIGITRIGCFLAGCCYGRPTGCACGVTFPADAPATLHFGQVPVHPSQLYGSLGGFLACGLLLLWERRSRPLGATFGRFLVLYGLARFTIDFSRYYEPEQVLALGWSNNQWLSLIVVAVGAAVLLGARGRTGDPVWQAEGRR